MKKLKSQNNIGYLYLLPAVILMGVFIIYSMILNVQISMTDWSGLSEKHFIAFANYVKLFRDKAFWDSLGVQLIWMLLSTVFHALGGLILSIIVEYFIHRKLQAVFRTLFFMPMMMSLVAVGILWTLIYNPLIGVINEILQVLGILSGNQTLDLLGDRSTALLAAFIPALWQWSSFGMVVFSAALQGMSRELLEAASLDGCSKWQQIRYIILPLLRPTIITVCTINLIGGMKCFDLLYTMTKGGPGTATQSTTIYIYKEMFTNSHYGYSAAMSMILFIVTVFVSLLFLRMTKNKN